MATFIVVMNGTKSGLKCRVDDGFTIGRKKGDLLLADDAKVSGTHAKVGIDNKGDLCLFDLDSSNGLVINNRKVRKIALLPGVIFRVGTTQFRVIKDDAISSVPSLKDFAVGPPADHVIEVPGFLPLEQNKPSQQQNYPTPPSPQPEASPAPSPKTWRQLLSDKLAVPPTEELDSREDLILGSFSPAVVLDFIEGPQADQKITLGYGPRKAGFRHLDIDLLDPRTPELSFELIPGPGSVEIKDLSGGNLFVNNRAIEVTFLEEGDIISIGHTKIKVRYL